MGRNRKYQQYIKDDEYGTCQRCGEVKYLGDGLCQVCWDTKPERIDQNKELKPIKAKR